MAAFNMSVIMDAIGDALIPVSKRVHPWPTQTINPPCFVVGYPSEFNYDFTMGRGSDEAVFPVYYICGQSADRNVRDELSRIIAGADSIKEALDGDLDGTVNSALVTSVSVTTIPINNVDYIAAQFDVEIIS